MKLCFVFPAEHKGTEAFRALVPPGKDPPPPLGGHTLLGEAVDDAAGLGN